MFTNTDAISKSKTSGELTIKQNEILCMLKFIVYSLNKFQYTCSVSRGGCYVSFWFTGIVSNSRKC